MLASVIDRPEDPATGFASQAKVAASDVGVEGAMLRTGTLFAMLAGGVVPPPVSTILAWPCDVPPKSATLPLSELT